MDIKERREIYKMGPAYEDEKGPYKYKKLLNFEAPDGRTIHVIEKTFNEIFNSKKLIITKMEVHNQGVTLVYMNPITGIEGVAMFNDMPVDSQGRRL